MVPLMWLNFNGCRKSPDTIVAAAFIGYLDLFPQMMSSRAGKDFVQGVALLTHYNRDKCDFQALRFFSGQTQNIEDLP